MTTTIATRCTLCDAMVAPEPHGFALCTRHQQEWYFFLTENDNLTDGYNVPLRKVYDDFLRQYATEEPEMVSAPPRPAPPTTGLWPRFQRYTPSLGQYVYINPLTVTGVTNTGGEATIVYCGENTYYLAEPPEDVVAALAAWTRRA